MPQFDRAGVRRLGAGDQPQQRALTGAVHADQRYALAPFDLEIHAGKHPAAAVAFRESARAHDLVAAPRRFGKFYPHGLRRGLDLLNFHFFELLHAALNLGGLARLVAKALDEPLYPLDALALLNSGSLETLARGFPLGEITLVVHRVARDRPAREVRDLRRHVAQKPPVVRDENHDPAIVAQPALQPLHALRVQVVGRLVQQQYVGNAQQYRRERDPHPPSAGEFAAGPVLVARQKTEPAQHLFRRQLEGVTAPRVELALELLVRRERGFEPIRPGGQARHALRRLGEAGFERRNSRALRQKFHHRTIAQLDEILRKVADPGPALVIDRALVRLGGASQDAEQRRLAGPVVAYEPGPRAVRDEPVDVFQNRLFPE